MPGFFAELRRRNVVRVAGVYAVAGWLIAQAAALLESSLGLPRWFDGAIVAALLLGFPVALILAWAFELTPEGVKLTANAPEGAAPAPAKANRLDIAVLAGVALVAGLFMYDRMRPEPPSAQPRPAGAPQVEAGNSLPPEEASRSDAVTKAPPSAASIAVLPFADLSAEKDQQHFSDGIAEEILNVLARVEGLKVASRTSSFQFRAADRGVPQIAGDLGVRHVIEGSVRKSGDAIRITAQLIDAETDEHLWSENYNRTLTAENLFAIQDEIAAAIVAALREKIGAEVGAAAAAPIRTKNVDAYERFLEARAYFQARRNLGEADRLLEEALSIDPNFADALAIRAAIHQFGGEYGARFENEDAARKQGRAFAEKALSIDAGSSLALGITALTHLYDRIEGHGSVEYAEIFAGFERALARDPMNANVVNWQGIAYAYLGYHEKAAAIHRRCAEIDPALAACQSNLAGELIGMGRKDDAMRAIDSAIDEGAFAVGPVQMIVLAELNRRDAFLLLSLNVSGLEGFRKFNALYDALIDPREDPALAAEIKALFVENKASDRTYVLLNALGDYESPALVIIHWGDVLRGYRRSPAFKQHMRASGAYDYWRKHGFPPQCKPVGKDAFECE